MWRCAAWTSSPAAVCDAVPGHRRGDAVTTTAASSRSGISGPGRRCGPAYLHVLLHCMLRHLWKKRGRAPELWDLACDVAVWRASWTMLDYPCLAGGFVPAKQKFYGECRAEMPVLTAEGIYRPSPAAGPAGVRAGPAPADLSGGRSWPVGSGPAGPGAAEAAGAEVAGRLRKDPDRTGGRCWPARLTRRRGGAGADPGGQPGRRGLPDLPPEVRPYPGGDGG